MRPLFPTALRAGLRLGVLLGAALTGLTAQPARAAQQTEFETVGPWKILQGIEADGSATCVAARGYKEEGDDKITSVVLGREGEQIIVSLGYGGWSFDPAYTRHIVLLVGERIVDLRSTWKAEGTQLLGSLSGKLLPALTAADRIVLRFKDGDATFKTDGLTAAFEGLARCAAPPPEPPQARVNAYLVAILLQQAIDKCDVPTTARQRSDLAAKTAALKPEMRGVETEVRKAVAEINPGGDCPTGAKIETFRSKLATFLSLSPEAFAAELERADAEAQAKEEAEKRAAAKASADRAAAEKAAADKAAAEKAAADKAASDRKAAEARGREKKAAPEAGAPDGATGGGGAADEAPAGAKPADEAPAGAKPAGKAPGAKGAAGGKPGAAEPKAGTEPESRPVEDSKPAGESKPDAAPPAADAPKP